MCTAEQDRGQDNDNDYVDILPEVSFTSSLPTLIHRRCVGQGRLNVNDDIHIDMHVSSSLSAMEDEHDDNDNNDVLP